MSHIPLNFHVIYSIIAKFLNLTIADILDQIISLLWENVL